MSPWTALCFELVPTTDKHCAVYEVEIGDNVRVYRNKVHKFFNEVSAYLLE